MVSQWFTANIRPDEREWFLTGVITPLAAPPAAPDTARRGGGEGPMRRIMPTFAAQPAANSHVPLPAPRVAPLHLAAGAAGAAAGGRAAPAKARAGADGGTGLRGAGRGHAPDPHAGCAEIAAKRVLAKYVLC